MGSRLKITGLTFLFAASGICCGCRKDDIQVYRLAKDSSAPPATTSLPADHPPIGSMDSMPLQSPPAATPPSGTQENSRPAPLHWKAPAGWKEEPASGMRLASFKIPGSTGQAADLSVVALPGPAGGDLANVNRWRGQIGLGPLGDKEFQSQSRQVRTGAGTARVVDFTGPGSAGAKTRLLAAILVFEGQSWFFKMTGGEATVGGAKDAFLEFLGGLHPSAHE